MMRSYRNYEDVLVEGLKDSEHAVAYLKAALEDYDTDRNTESLLLALRDIAKAQGGVAELAKRTNLNRESLYRALSEKGNPKLETFESILHGLGFRLSVEPLEV